jgi:hypothetical protein
LPSFLEEINPNPEGLGADKLKAFGGDDELQSLNKDLHCVETAFHEAYTSMFDEHLNGDRKVESISNARLG